MPRPVTFMRAARAIAVLALIVLATAPEAGAANPFGVARPEAGVTVQSGPLAGLCARAVVVLDEDNKVLHSELVDEIKKEPDYDAALAVL